MPGGPLTRLSHAIARRPRLLLAAALAATLAAVVPALRIRVEPDLSALLPNGSPGADEYRLFLRTFGGFEKVFVLVRSAGKRPEDPAPLLEAAAALADYMRRSPEVADARSGITEDDERFFFRWVAPRMPLLLGGDWRGDLAGRLAPAALRQRVAMMRQTLSSPAGPAAARLFAGDPLGLSAGLLGAASAALPVEPLSGAFLSRRGDAALVVLTPARAEIDPAGGRALLARLRAGYARVRAQSAVPLAFAAVGGPLYAAADESIARGDVTRTASSTFLGVAVVLLAGFEGLLLPAAILLAVGAGMVWTAGLAGLALGELTFIGVGFTAALLGMGVDYGIFGGARYRDLRLSGMGVAAALAGAFREAGPGVLTGVAATAAALSTLLAAHFRPLREMGAVLALGVLATLLATATLGAALVAGAPGAARRPPAPPRLWARRGLPGLRGLVGFAVRRARWVLGAALLLSSLAAWGAWRLTLSTDLRALRPADHPAAEAERLLVESFPVGLDTLSVVVGGRTLEEALDRAAEVKGRLRARLGERADIVSPSDWLITGRRLARRLRELRALPLERAAADLERELPAAGFRLAPFTPAVAALRAMGRGEDPGAPPPAEWPRWMAELVRSGPGVFGAQFDRAAVAVHARLADGSSAESLAALGRELSAIAPGHVALASIPRVGAEIKDLALGDLRRSSTVAVAVVLAIVLIAFRGRPGETLLAFLPLALGCLWTFGIWGALGRPVDLLAVFTVPLLLGTGIDLGAYAVYWRRLHPHRGFAGTAEDAGLAMIMATLTTALGFGSLSTSRVPGLQHAGILVAAGMTACLLATIIVLPAGEALLRRRTASSSGE